MSGVVLLEIRRINDRRLDLSGWNSLPNVPSFLPGFVNQLHFLSFRTMSGNFLLLLPSLQFNFKTRIRDQIHK